MNSAKTTLDLDLDRKITATEVVVDGADAPLILEPDLPFDQDLAVIRPGWSTELAGLVTDMVGFDVRLPSGWAAFVLAVPGPWMAPVSLLLDAAGGRLDGTPAPDAVTAPAVLTSLAPGIPNERVTGHQMRTLLHRLVPSEQRSAVVSDAWASASHLRDDLEFRADAWASRVLRAALVAVLVSALSLVCAGLLREPVAAVVFGVGGVVGLAAGVAAVTLARRAAQAVDDERTGNDLWVAAIALCGAIGDRPLLPALRDPAPATRRRHLDAMRRAVAGGAEGPLRHVARAVRMRWTVSTVLGAVVWAVSVVTGWGLV